MKNEDAATDNFSLSEELLENFIHEGYVILKGVFSKEVAEACRNVIWGHLEEKGISRSNKDTWEARVGLSNNYSIADGDPWNSIFSSPLLKGAINSLLGEGI